MQKNLSENLENWEYISRYSDWMYRSYRQWIGKKVFDVGAGMGRLVSYYLPSAEKVIATDIFQNQVDHMNEKFCMYSAFTAKKLDILEDDLTEFQGRFDTVLCINVLEHLSDDKAAVRKMYSLLEPGGNLIIMVPAFQKLYCQMDANVSHYRRYDRNVLQKMANNFGYVIAHDGYFNMLGILPYYIKGKRKQGTGESFSSDLNESNSKIYNFASRLLEPLEKRCPPPLGFVRDFRNQEELKIMKEERKNVIQPEGNFYDKYHSGNFIVRKLMKGFFDSYRRLLSEVKTDIQSCLEGGVGEGEIAEFIYDYFGGGIKVSGFDISEKVVNEANARLNGKDVHLWTGNIYDLQIDQKYDLVICSEVLEHLEHPEMAVAQLKKAAGKYMIFSVPQERLWCFLNLCRGKYIKAFGNTPGHIQHWSKKRFVRFLHDNGLEIIQIESPIPWTVVLAKADATNSNENAIKHR